MRQKIYHTCKNKLMEIDSDTTLVNCIGYCRKCKKEVMIDVIKGTLVGLKDLERKEVECHDKTET